MGAILNAHPDAVISNEADAADHILHGCSRDALFSRILAVSEWFHARGNTSLYSYAIPGQWQGRFRTLSVIGDKRGGAVTRAIEAHPDFLDRVRALVRVPLRLVHVVRHPLDNIATISKRHGFSLAESSDFYFRHADVTRSLDSSLPREEWLTLWHEDLIADPRAAIAALGAHVGLKPEPGHAEACASVILSQPHRSREDATWPIGLQEEILRRLPRYPFLKRYAVEN